MKYSWKGKEKQRWKFYIYYPFLRWTWQSNIRGCYWLIFCKQESLGLQQLYIILRYKTTLICGFKNKWIFKEEVNFCVLPKYNRLYLGTAKNNIEDVLMMFSLSASIQTLNASNLLTFHKSSLKNDHWNLYIISLATLLI